MPPTWEEACATVQEAALAMGEMAGLPIPVLDHKVSMARGHRQAARLDGATLGVSEPSSRACSSRDVDEEQGVRNSWWSTRLRTEIFIAWHGRPGEPGFRVEAVYDRWAIQLEGLNRWRMMMDTFHAGLQAWSFDAEVKATAKLAGLLTEHQIKSYMLTGGFFETSKRSGAVYIFRRLRPTIVLLRGREGNYHPSCALCFHPLAYYSQTWAGALVPTDEVVASLLMMRGDEKGLWRRSNQHPIHRMEAGL